MKAFELCVVSIVLEFRALRKFTAHALVDIGRRRKRRDEVLERSLTVNHLAGLDDPRPAHNAGHAPAAFPVGVLLSSELGTGAISK
jgi:hypothetical protein